LYLNFPTIVIISCEDLRTENIRREYRSEKGEWRDVEKEKRKIRKKRAASVGNKK
jgi:hypothetical protein